jgi:hypothetical protein
MNMVGDRTNIGWILRKANDDKLSNNFLYLQLPITHALKLRTVNVRIEIERN